MSKCKLCEKVPEYEEGLCENCSNTVFYLKDIIENYLMGAAAEPRVINALREFTWLYAGYPRLWGYYNSIINTVYIFITKSKDYITEVDLDYFDFTSLDKDEVLDILYETKALKKPDPSSPGLFKIGDLTNLVTKKIKDELTNDTGKFKETAEEMFGIVSIMLTYILIKKKLKDPESTILPRKAISLFLTFNQIILENFGETDDIPQDVSIDLFTEQQKLINVSKSTQFKILLEMLGLTYISPGIPNIISNVDSSYKTLKFKDTIRNFLEYERERLRERERIRKR